MTGVGSHQQQLVLLLLLVVLLVELLLLQQGGPSPAWCCGWRGMPPMRGPPQPTPSCVCGGPLGTPLHQ